MTIIILEALIVYQVQNDIVSNDFVVKRSESECFLIKSCDKWLCDWYTDKIFSSLSSDVKKKRVLWNPLTAQSAPVLYFNHNHNNSVSKKS